MWRKIHSGCAVLKIQNKQRWWPVFCRTWWTSSSVTWSHCEARRFCRTTRWSSCLAASTGYSSFTDCSCRASRTSSSERSWRSDQPTTSSGSACNLRRFFVATIAGPLLWNALPTYLCVLPNKKIFRNRYKNTYLKLWYCGFSFMECITYK